MARGQDDPLRRARDAASAGRIGAALGEYERFLTAHPADVDVLREAARVAGRERRFCEAIRWLKRVVEIDPATPGGWYDLGAAWFNTARYEMAIPALRQMDTLEATDPALATRAEQHFLHGDAARRIEQWGEAVAELEIAVTRAPNRKDFRRVYAEALQNAGRFSEAASEFAQLVRGEPSAENHYGLGVALGEQNKLDDAVVHLRDARRLKPKEPRILTKLGQYCMRKNELSFAETFLLEAREVAPQNLETLFALAQVYRLQGRADDAAAQRAEAETVQKEADLVRERDRVFRRRVVNEPEDLAAHLAYGLDLLQQGRFDDAQTIFQRILSFAPTHDLAILNLSSLLLRNGDPAGAMKEVAKLLDLDPKHPVANLQAGRLKLYGRDPGAALTYLKAGLEKGETNREIHEALAACYAALGDREKSDVHRNRAEALAAEAAAAESRPAPDSRPGTDSRR